MKTKAFCEMEFWFSSQTYLLLLQFYFSILGISNVPITSQSKHSTHLNKTTTHCNNILNIRPKFSKMDA